MNNTIEAYSAARAAREYLTAEDSEVELLDEDFVFEDDFSSDQFSTYPSRDFYWLGHVSPAETTSAGTFKLLDRLIHGSLSQLARVGDRIIGEIGRVKDGWAGEGTRAPSRQMISDVEQVSNLLPTDARSPVIELDEDDGSVSLRWISEADSRSFSLVFRGNGQVISVIATLVPARSSPMSFAITDEVQIAARFDDAIVRSIIAS